MALDTCADMSLPGFLAGIRAPWRENVVADRTDIALIDARAMWARGLSRAQTRRRRTGNVIPGRVPMVHGRWS